MPTLSHLFENNKAWAGRIRQQDPEFFVKLSQQQSPTYLWIGCSDSRVPANQIVGLRPENCSSTGISPIWSCTRT